MCGPAPRERWPQSKERWLPVGHHPTCEATLISKTYAPLKAPQEYFNLNEANELPLPPEFANKPTVPIGADLRNTRLTYTFAGRDFRLPTFPVKS
ncbi:MAG: hypothetical protein R3F13_01610 [Prosthecobacter sp.]